MGLPENIDALLVKYEINQDQLARVARVAPSTVARWRQGSQMRRSQLERICEYFGLTEDDLLSTESGLAAKEHGRVSDATLADDEQMLVQTYRMMGANERDALMVLLRALRERRG